MNYATQKQTILHNTEYEWANKLPDIIDVQDDFDTLIKIPCELYGRIPIGKISKKEVLSIYEKIKKDELSKIIEIGEKRRKREEKYEIEIKNNKDDYLKNMKEIENRFLGKYIAYDNGNIIGVSNKESEIIIYWDTHPTSFITEVGFDNY